MFDSQVYLSSLESIFKEHSNPKIAEGQTAYMKHLFDFYGIKAPKRQELSKDFFLKETRPPKESLNDILIFLWQKPERDFQYFAQELFFKYKSQLVKDDINILVYMITHKSWWDTIDFIAPKLVAEYFSMFPELRDDYLSQWIASGNIWLQRTGLIFQLKYKQNTDLECLHDVIISLLGSKEFFINKAIGWSLRELSKTNPDWVLSFVDKYGDKMANLSKREALRIILNEKSITYSSI